MPKPQNQKGYSCRVNILKYVKVADKWRFAPAQTQNNKLKVDWVLVDGQPERHPEGTDYIEWYENGTRRRQSVKDSAEVLEQTRRKAIELDAGKAEMEIAETEEGAALGSEMPWLRILKKSSRPSANRRPTRRTNIACKCLLSIARRPIFRMW